MNRDTVATQLVDFLTKPQAHITLSGALDDLPPAMRGKRAEGMPYSVWQLLHHIEFAQRDILNFSLNNDGRGGKYSAPAWPKDYWLPDPEPAGETAFQQSLDAIGRDLAAFCDLLRDPERDLLQRFAWGEGQNLMREALLIGDHNAYHIGEIVAVRRALGCWSKS